MVTVIDEEAAITTSSYMNLPVVSAFSELNAVNAIIITNMENPQKKFDETIKFFPRDQVLNVSLLGINREVGNTSKSTFASAEV